MEERRVVEIAALAPTVIDASGPLRSGGHLPFLPAETARRARNAVFVNAGAREARLQAEHSAIGQVRGCGLHVLSEAIVMGHSFVVVGGRLVVDGSVPSMVSEQFAKRDGLLDDPPRAMRVVEENLLVVAGPGYPIWGHWLLDFLPRVSLAQQVLGADLGGYRIPLPSDTPRWVAGMLRFFCGLDEDRLVAYDIAREAVGTRGLVVVPDFLHSDYFLHSAIKPLYDRFASPLDRSLPRRICVSRRDFREGRSVIRRFPMQAAFEEAASRRGYALVRPETLTFRQQIDLFANAHAVVGEYGSGMHNTLFARGRVAVGQFIMPSTIQSRIAGLRDHSSVFLLPDNDPRFDSAEIASMEVSERSIGEFFDAMEAVCASDRAAARSRSSIRMERHQVIQGLLDLYEQPRYLEVGVNRGDTFLAVRASAKAAVDPKFLFDVEAAGRSDASASFFQQPSDAYFGALARGERFDVIYLDGLHTFEQTLRDFCNAILVLAEGGMIIVDDILPSSYPASIPDLATAERLKMALSPTDPDLSWMGDVYRLVFFIETFFQQCSYACVVENHGQLVVWRTPRPGGEVPHRSVASVAALPFEVTALARPSFRWQAFADIRREVEAHIPRAGTVRQAAYA